MRLDGKLLSFDIGTRHLAYCILSRRAAGAGTDVCTDDGAGYKIHDWRVVDLLAVRGTPYDDELVYAESKGWKVARLRQWLATRGEPSDGRSEQLRDRVHAYLRAAGVRRRASNDVTGLAAKLFRLPTAMRARVVLRDLPSSVFCVSASAATSMII